jgi:hypothetical protein
VCKRQVDDLLKTQHPDGDDDGGGGAFILAQHGGDMDDETRLYEDAYGHVVDKYNGCAYDGGNERKLVKLLYMSL